MADRIATPWDTNPARNFVRGLVRYMYDFQVLRIGAKNRGIRRADRSIQAQIEKANTQKEMDEVVTIKRKTDKGELPPIHLTLAHIAEWDRVAEMSEALETAQAKLIRSGLKELNRQILDWITQWMGVADISAGIIMSELDPYRARHASSMWKFAGLDVVKVECPECDGDGCFRCGNKGHIGRGPRLEKGTKAPYNKFLRTKLVGVIGPNILKACVRSETEDWDADKRRSYEGKGWKRMETCSGVKWVRDPYAEIYWNQRNKLADRPDEKFGFLKANGVRVGIDAHREKMAIRYMMKMFLKDYYVFSRQALGLSVSESFHESRRGYRHGEAPEASARLSL